MEGQRWAASLIRDDQGMTANGDQQSSGMMIERVGINETGMMGEMGDEEEEPGMDQ